MGGMTSPTETCAPSLGFSPAVARGEAVVDAFDGIEDLPIEGVGLFHVLTAKSLMGPCAHAWLHTSIISAWTIAPSRETGAVRVPEQTYLAAPKWHHPLRVIRGGREVMSLNFPAFQVAAW